MTILVTGGHGQVGRALTARAGSDFPVRALARREWNIADAHDAERWIDAGTAAVINCAAYTAVDAAEDDQAAAFAANDAAVGVLVERCRRFGTPLLHLSTDYVFDGEKKGAYVEADPISPLGVYGRSKAAGEARLVDAGIPHIVLRVAWVFGSVGRSFVETMLRLADREELTVVDDQIGCPTPAAGIADVIRALACGDDGAISRAEVAQRWHERSGIYHLAGTPALSWYDFARIIFDRARDLGVLVRSPRLIPIPSEGYPTKVRRPRNSRLATDKIERVFGVSGIDWRRHLDDFLRSLA